MSVICVDGKGVQKKNTQPKKAAPKKKGDGK